MEDSRESKAKKECERVARLLAEAPCILCGKTPAKGGGMWKPREGLESLCTHATDGKVVVYALCDECKKVPGAMAQVEKVILREAATLS